MSLCGEDQACRDRNKPKSALRTLPKVNAQAITFGRRRLSIVALVYRVFYLSAFRVLGTPRLLQCICPLIFSEGPLAGCNALIVFDITL